MMRAVGKLEDKCEKLTEKRLRHMGKKAPKCYEYLGQVLSYADIIGSCTFDCPGPTHEAHAVLYLIARSSSFGRAALRLAKMGFYDEALNIVRSIGEMANLFMLFALDANSVEEWRKSDRAYRLKHLSPAKIRERIVVAGEKPAMDEETYRNLCEISTHPVPELRPQQFNHAGRSMTAGVYFQNAGFLVVLNELANAISLLVGFATIVCKVPKEVAQKIGNACVGCARFAGGITLKTLAEALKTTQSS